MDYETFLAILSAKKQNDGDEIISLEDYLQQNPY